MRLPFRGFLLSPAKLFEVLQSAMAAEAIIDAGYLQEDHKSLFSPGLSADKVAAITGIGFGYNEKIFVEFENEACSEEPVSQVPCVAYHLLWNIPWPGPQKEQILCNGSAASGDSFPAPEELPTWVHGIFSFRCASLSDSSLKRTALCKCF